MKSIIILLVFILILSGCDMSFDPFGDWGDNTESRINYYKATISVRYDIGDPCTTARAYFHHDYIFADSTTGILKFLLEVEYESSAAPTQSLPCIVYKSWYKELIWEGKIILNHVRRKDSKWPDPFVEIVIPN